MSAEAAERTSGAIYDHFGGKAGLLFALLEGWVDDVAAVITAELVAAATLDARLAALWRNITQPPAGDDRWIRLEHELWSYAARDERAREHLARRYGLTEVSLAGRSPEAEPSPRELEELVEDVRASGATTVFAEPLVSDEVAETVAREADLVVRTLDPVEGLSEERLDAGEDYLTVMRTNLAALREALGCR